MHATIYDRTGATRCVRSLGKTSDERLSRIYFIVLYFVADKSFTADGRSTVTGCVKDNTSKDPFSQCEQLQGIHIQVKSEYVGTFTTIELVTRKQSDKQNNMFNVAANLEACEHSREQQLTTRECPELVCL